MGKIEVLIWNYYNKKNIDSQLFTDIAMKKTLSCGAKQLIMPKPNSAKKSMSRIGTIKQKMLISKGIWDKQCETVVTPLQK